YYLVLTNSCGHDTSSMVTLNLTAPTGVGGPGSAITAFQGVWPNPTRGLASLAFSLAHPSSVRFEVYDVSGRRVRRIDLGSMAPGPHQAAWDTRGDNGQRLREGLYFVALDLDGRDIGDRRLVITR